MKAPQAETYPGIETCVPKQEDRGRLPLIQVIEVDCPSHEFDIAAGDINPLTTPFTPQIPDGLLIADNDPDQRQKMYGKSSEVSEAVAKKIGIQLSEEFKYYLAGHTNKFRAYFVLCEKIYDEDTQTSIVLHKLPHETFLSELGTSIEQLKTLADEESRIARLRFGIARDAIGVTEDNILEARFQYMPEAEEPFAVYYAADRDACDTKDERYFLTPYTAC